MGSLDRRTHAAALQTTAAYSITSVIYSGQLDRALVFATHQRVREFLKGVGSAATGVLVFAGATGPLIRVFLEMRPLLPTLVYLVATLVGVDAGPRSLPTLVGHVLVFSHALGPYSSMQRG